MSFICTRVKSPDEDDYKKLTRVIQYLLETIHLTLTIKLDDNPKCWVDSSNTMHPDMKSQTVIFMSIGKGGTYTSSCKQKLNTKSCMEAELVAIDVGEALSGSTECACTNENHIGHMNKTLCIQQ